MAISIPAALVEFILLGPDDDRRQLQDSPILGDVWIDFAKTPGERLDLLITPFRTQPAGQVASKITDDLGVADDDANIAYLQGVVVARLFFEDVLQVVLPLTQWWIEHWHGEEKTDVGKSKSTRSKGGVQDSPAKLHDLMAYDASRTAKVVRQILEAVDDWNSNSNKMSSSELLPLERFVALAGLLLWARKQKSSKKLETKKQIKHIVKNADPGEIGKLLEGLWKRIKPDPQRQQLVFNISRNRTAAPALAKSIPAVKADAAKFLFKVDCSEITWAVIDSGIDGTHSAFGGEQGSRVKKAFDFRNFRKIVSLSNSNEKVCGDNADAVRSLEGLLYQSKGKQPSKAEVAKDLKELATAAKELGAIRWEIVEKYVEIAPKTPTKSNHGTHVAGILGASKKHAQGVGSGAADGMCPDINLYDFRVIGPNLKDTEFAIIAVLQYIRYLNDRDNFFTIHGANLSLSIPHDVRNFACGRTPICNESERLGNSGVVVVAAAGNHGYKSFETKDGAYESYTAFSITDPGNADDVITVGATHRYWPHTYGVSFFSSRGPTGDGRLKPDLVAPGERIRAPWPGDKWGDLDGTSMAAPHVSGAAAMLMARYSELIGQPRRIKRILCENATDLGRERSFQGHGMLDVLRAFQSV